MEMIKILTGAALLTLGRKLYWLFIAAVGFITGLSIFPLLFPRSDSTTILIASLALGIIGALLAVLLQKFALLIAGFFAGAYCGVYLFKLLNLATGDIYWLIFILGGIVGVFLIGAIFDWALIILSSITGASLLSTELSQYLQSGFFVNAGIFLILLLAGLIIQNRINQK